MAVTETSDGALAPGGALARLLTRVRAVGQGANAASQKMAAMAFVIRIASAGIVFVTQALLARWMGAREFGTYVYVWTLLVVAADIVHLGIPLTAQRFIPEYRERGSDGLLRGYLSGSCWLVFAAGSLAALIGVGIVYATAARMEPSLAGALYLACAALPFYSVTLMIDGIARSFSWMVLALFPAYIVRPIVFIGAAAALYAFGFPLDATLIMGAMAAAAWLAVIMQVVPLFVRLRGAVPRGARQFAARIWLRTALPMVMSWGLYTLLTSIDIVVLKHFRPAEDVAHYFAASKTVALVAIIYFAVAAATAHRFTTFAAADNRAELENFAGSTVRWMFWPSLALGGALVAIGPLVLRLFGEDFLVAYPAMAILVLGHLSRASIGPAERILSMLGQQRACVMVYAAAVLFNIGASVALVPRYGISGAAVATAGSFMLESLLLFWLARQRIGIHLFVWRPRVPLRGI